MNKSYWQKFFKKLKKENQDNEYFEWYGDYKAFDHLLKQYINVNDQIVHVGCGKSLLSEQLYDQGVCKHIMNVDFEKTSLEQMKQRSLKRPEMLFECLSLTEDINLPQFDVVLDKGTLDAIYPEEDVQEVRKYLDNLTKLAKRTTIIVSLLQEHILKILLEYSNHWGITIYETVIEKSKLYPFFIVLDMQNKYQQINFYNLSGEKQEYSQKQIIEHIKKIQLQNHFITQIHKLRQSQSFTLDLWSLQNKQVPRFTLFIYDSEDQKQLLLKTCAIFIIPQGREQSFIFGTPQGQKILHTQVNTSRLIIARLNPGQKFGDLKAVQAELSPMVQSLIPKGCLNMPCPFMTDGDEIGDKRLVFESEEAIVEDVNIEDQIYRRLFLKNSLDLVQAQARMRNDHVDHSYLDFEAHVAMIAGFGFTKSKEVLILGGGVGLLSNFILTHLKQRVTNIEICEDIIMIAKTLYEYQEKDDQRMMCGDALDYVKHIENSHQFDVIIIDINSDKQNTLSPPQQFLTQEFLTLLKSLLTKNGVIMINVLDSNRELKQLPWNLYFSRKCENELNEVYYLINEEFQTNENGLIINLDFLNQLEASLKEFKNQKYNWDTSINIRDEVEAIKLKYPIIKTQAFQVQSNQIMENNQIKDQRKEFYEQDLSKIDKKKKQNRKRRR